MESISRSSIRTRADPRLRLNLNNIMMPPVKDEEDAAAFSSIHTERDAKRTLRKFDISIPQESPVVSDASLVALKH